MSELKQFDDTQFEDDEYETPYFLFDFLKKKYKVYPTLDVAANDRNKKCERYLTDGLHSEWLKDSWCNPPHSMTEQFVRKAHEEWAKHNINIMMIIPTNTMSSKFWHHCIEGIAEYHAVEGRVRFLRYGRPARFNSRNAYVCVIWRKRN